jgi:4-amino-4-deoxy-L-arabinose transferase-like glycosyltransferase
MKKFFLKNKAVLILFFIILLAFALRFYKLGEIPLGLNNDETAIGYNAYSIGQTGRDEYGMFMPLYFRSFDDYKLPVYIYMTTLSEKAFGVNAFAVRFSSMFFGVITTLSLFLLIKELSKRSDLALLTSFLWAVNPWNIFFSRTGFEVNVATALLVLGTLFFVKAFRTEKTNYLKLFLSLIFFIASLYSYNVARLASPLILCMLIVINRRRFFRLSRSFLVSFAVAFIICILPFILTLGSQSGLTNQQGSVFITGFNEKAQFLEFRSYFINLPSIISILFLNKFILIVFTYLKNVLSFFSVNFFFINGANNPIDGIMNFGMFYFIELPFILTGVYLGIKRKVKFLSIFYAWMVIVILLNALTIEVPNATRSYMVIVPMVVFSAYGCLAIIEYLRSLSKRIQIPIFTACLAIFLYSFAYFIGSYFVKFPVEFAKSWRAEDKALVTFLMENQNKYNLIIFDKKADFIYTALLFYLKYPPAEYQKDASYQKNGLLNILAKVGKFEFKDVDWTKRSETKGPTLIIADPSVIQNNNYMLLTKFYFPTKPVVNVANGEIIAYPFTKPAYQVLETK